MIYLVFEFGFLGLSGKKNSLQMLAILAYFFLIDWSNEVSFPHKISDVTFFFKDFFSAFGAAMKTNWKGRENDSTEKEKRFCGKTFCPLEIELPDLKVLCRSAFISSEHCARISTVLLLKVWLPTILVAPWKCDHFSMISVLNHREMKFFFQTFKRRTVYIRALYVSTNHHSNQTLYSSSLCLKNRSSTFWYGIFRLPNLFN